MNSKREYGIDLLRILSMIMIVILHVLGQGGVLRSVEFLSDKYMIVWFLEIISYCAVNCYAMISGYVMYNRRMKLDKIISLWFQTLFYSVTISLCFFLFNIDDIREPRLLEYLFPISKKIYWYLTAYFGMLFFVPFLNIIIEKLNRKIMFLTLFNIVILVSINPLTLYYDTFKLDDGYSLMWLMVLYLVGGFISKYKISKNMSFFKCLVLYFSGICLTYISKVGIELLYRCIGVGYVNSNIFINYVAITMVASAIGLILFFSKLNISNKLIIKLISIVSPLTLGVYLIHSHPMIYDEILYDAFSDFSSYSLMNIILLVFLTALIIFLICITIERIRIIIFKLLRMDKLNSFVVNKIINLENRFYKLYFNMIK